MNNHEITIKESNGKKDVIINIGKIKVNDDDPATATATRIINDEIIPSMAQKIAKSPVVVTVINKVSEQHVSQVVEMYRVRAFAEAVVGSLIEKHKELTQADFMIVEYHQRNGQVIVSKL